MKKLFKFALCSLMALTLVACGSGDSKVNKDTLVVGTPELSGDFLDGFGNSSYDLMVKNMLYGYTTYYYNAAGEYLLDNTAIKDVVINDEADGSKTYTFTVNEGLKWSDGETLDANDYVFALLWGASKQWVDAGASSLDGEGLKGKKEYVAGETDVFAGVKLIDDYTFSATIAAEELPFFYEASLVAITPKPQHVFSADSTIETTDAGAKLVAADLSGDMAKIADGDNAYRYAPTAVSGPYKFVSFKNQIVTLEINEEFAGDPDGDKPTIPTVIVKYVDQSTDMDTLIKGDVDILNGVVEGDKIEKAKAEVEEGNLKESNYARNGYGYVAMATEYGTTSIKEVRHAIAYILDNDEIINSVLGGYGSSVYGDYGVAQWMYKDNAEAIDGLTTYAFSVTKANESLDKTDYKFEADGVTPWDSAKAVEADDYYRYNSNGEVLEIKHFGTDDNTVTDAIENQFNANGPRAGMKITVTRGDFDSLLSNYYYRYEQTDEEKYNTFNLAVGFTAVYDPYRTYHTDFLNTWENATQTNSPILDELSVSLRQTAPENVDEYSAKWLEFQTAWNEYLPLVPIYSNSYFDFYNAGLEGIETTPLKDWSTMVSKIKWAE